MSPPTTRPKREGAGRGGGAVLLPEGECTPQRLYGTAADLLGDKARRSAMSRSLHRWRSPDAEKIYETLMRWRKGKIKSETA